MKYNVEALKQMIESYSNDIATLSIDPEKNEVALAEMVKDRRDIAALIENEGVPLQGVYVDAAMYARG